MKTIFTENLAKLIDRDENVAMAALRMGINRTQLNRYRFGDASPQPDALRRICAAYGTDERILSQPIEVLDEEKAVADPGKAAEILTGLRALIGESDGVAGFHRNGDIAGWQELGFSADDIDAALSADSAAHSGRAEQEGHDQPLTGH